MNPRLRHALAKTPRLFAAFLAWRNGGWRTTRWRAAALCAAWAAWAFLAPTAVRNWMRQEPVLLGVAAAGVATILVARRRASNRDEARRSWTAALPVGPRAARLQALAIETAPAWRLAIAGTLLCAGPDGTLVSWAALLGGVAAGTVLGLLMPSARAAELPEGSRYVPHRRRAGQALPRGSLAALGAWPVRQMFASARPKVVAQATVPVLLLMPMGTRADAALVVLGGAAVIGGLLLLVDSIASVTHAGLRWLAPLPVAPGVLLLRIGGRAGWALLLAAGLEAWLPSLLGATAQRCVQIGSVTLAAGTIAMLTASWVGRRRAVRESR